MNLDKDAFDQQFQETLQHLIESMASDPAIAIKDFYNMACYFENLAIFSPVLFGLISNAKK